jgi:DNA-binding IclR family transcriptional regulator
LAVKSSRAVFEVLRVVAAAGAPLGAAEIARLLSLPTTTAVRALSTLEAAGYVLRHNGSPRFILGTAGQRLAYAFMAQFPIRDLALPYLQQLTLLSGSSSSLFIRLGWYSVRIALIAGTASVVNVGTIGEARPLTAGAPSRAILAHLPDADFTRAVHRHGANPDHLLELCRQIRAQGYAIAPSQLQSGGQDLAFPLIDHTQSVIAAIALEGMADTDAPQAQATRALETLAPLQAILAGGSVAAAHYGHVDPDDIRLE